MSGHGIVEFISAHASCGDLRREWADRSLSIRCLGCGATTATDFVERSEADLGAALGAAIETLDLSHEELVTLSDPDVSPEVAAGIVRAHPELKALLDTQYDLAGRRQTKH